MQALCSTETAVDFRRTTWPYVAEDGIHHNHRCESLGPYIIEIKYNTLKKQYFRSVFSYRM
jgi:hypothetical protein